MNRYALVLMLLSVLGGAVYAGDANSASRETHVHLDKQGALQQVFPHAEQVLELRYLLTSEESARIEKSMGRRLDEGGFYLYAGLTGGKPVGYAAIVSQIGKVKPITHIVGVNPQGDVSQVAVMIYRESHGAEVVRRRFMEQYEGKSLDDPIRINRDIINIAGATLSGHAICRGVRKALSVVDEVFLSHTGPEVLALLTGPGALADDVTPGGLRNLSPAAAPVATLSAAGSLRLEREIMGTVVSVEAYPEVGGVHGDQLAVALNAALDEVERWDDVLSNWRTDTALSALNEAPVGEALPIDPALMDWLEDARHWAEESHGRFDPALGALVDAWQLNSREPCRPEATRLEAALAACGLQQFVIDRNAGTVTRLNSEALLDPGASGKGYALDRAAAVLRDHGVQSALLSFRSTLLALGPPPGQDGWVVPVIHDGEGEQVSEVLLAHGALSVSGGALRAHRDGTVLRGHVLDPFSGVPVEAARLAWVQHDSAAASDALATALLVAGPSLLAVPGAAGAFVASAGQPLSDWPPSP